MYFVQIEKTSFSVQMYEDMFLTLLETRIFSSLQLFLVQIEKTSFSVQKICRHVSYILRN
jgi:hypothetical protein